MWFWFALGSAVFAALTSILAKIGIEGVNSNLATAIRTMVVVVMAWGMVFLTNTQGGIKSHRRFLAVLLQSPANRGGFQGRADRQAECCHHAGTGLHFLARGVHRQVPDRLYTDWRGDVGYGAVKD